MTKKRCPGMDPAYFKPEDIRTQKCTDCGREIEFWKDDVFLVCPDCGTGNANERIKNTCLAWCRQAASCIHNRGIDERLRLERGGKKEDH